MEVPQSISSIYYKLGKYGWIFQLMLALVSIVLLPLWVSVSTERLQFLCFLACGSLLIISAAPCFKQSFEGKIHYGAAILCCTSAILWQLTMGLWDILLWFMVVSLMLSLQMKDKWCFWLECATAGSLLASLYCLI